MGLGLSTTSAMKFNKAEGPGSGQPQAQTQSGQRMEWQQPWEEGFGGVHGWEAQHDPAKQTHSPEKTQPHPGLHHKQSDQQVEGGDSAPLGWDPIWIWGPQNKKNLDLLEGFQRQPWTGLEELSYGDSSPMDERDGVHPGEEKAPETHKSTF